jgi:hypothetical protein
MKTWGLIMGSNSRSTLKFFSLLFLLPGLAGLIVSAVLSLNYGNTLPKFPMPEQSRTVPRAINGQVIYQTEAEDRKLNEIEFASVGVFVLGAVLGLVYLAKWGMARAIAPDDEDAANEV